MTLPLLQKSIVSLTCLTLMASPCFASDGLGAGVDRWSGLYGGLNIGSSGGGGLIDNYNGNKEFELTDSALTFGGHLGYNFAPFGRRQGGGWIWGLEMDLSTLNLDKSKTDSVLGKVNLDSSFAFSTRLRAGYAWDDSLYLYGTLGLGFTDMKFDDPTDKGKTLYGGLVYGLGAEYALSDSWSARVEGMVYDLGSPDYKVNGTTRNIDHGFATIKFGISTKF